MLRPYQQECLNAILKSNSTKGLCILPTGAGKSHIIAKLGGLCVVPRIELARQNQTKGANCVTINRAYLDKVEGDLLIIDEAHLVNKWGGMYQSVMDKFKKVIGFTATPYRLNSGHLVPETFDTIIYNINRNALINKKYLVKRHFVNIPYSHILNIKTKHVNNLQKLSAEVCQDTKKCLDFFLTTWDGEKTIIYTCDLMHAEKVKTILFDYNISIISSLTPTHTRHQIINSFKEGHLKLLINCELLTIGFDCPDLKNIVILRPTQSYSLYEQICGRGDRPHPTKTQNKIYDFTMSSFNWEMRKINQNTHKYCIYCYKLTDYRLHKCQHCAKVIIRLEVPKKKCFNCKELVISNASYCLSCGQFLKKNVYELKGNVHDISILKKDENNHTFIFNGENKTLKLYAQSKKSMIGLSGQIKNKKAYILHYKYDFFTKKPKILKFYLTS